MSFRSGDMGTSGWSTQQLAEFVAAVSAAESEESAAITAVERAAEMLDADVAAIVCDSELIAAIGYPNGTAPVDALNGVRPGLEESRLEVPGLGACAASAAPLEHPSGASLVIARMAPDSLTREESGLLRGMARVASMTMRTLRVLDNERAARGELERLAGDQAALRRVATLVAKGAPREDIYAAVADEIAQRLGVEVVAVLRYEADRTATIVGGWAVPGRQIPIGVKLAVEGEGVAVSVRRTGRPARVERFRGPPGSVAARFRSLGVQVGVGSPIVVEGNLWGVSFAASERPETLPAGSEARIAEFTELVAAAVANAEGRADLRRVADEQAALRRVATLVAQGVPADEVFAALASETRRILDFDIATLLRLESDGAVTAVAADATLPLPLAVGERRMTMPEGAVARVLRTGRPARVDGYQGQPGSMEDHLRSLGYGGSAAAPIVVEGHLWGVINVVWAQGRSVARGREDRLMQFGGLIATALANAEAREELRRVAEEQAALRRVATLVARRETHSALFTAVAEEVGRVVPHAAVTLVCRYDADKAIDVVGGWSRDGDPSFVGARVSLGGHNVSTLVFERNEPARVDHYDDDAPATALARQLARSSAGAPISVEGGLWGVMIVGAADEDALPAGTEHRLAEFTELIRTAIANAQAREELRRVADDQAALRRVATLVARGVPAAEIFDAVTEEVHRLLDADETGLSRYDPDGLWTVLAVRGAMTDLIPVGFRLDPGASMPGVTELLSGRSVRVDASPEATAVDDIIRAEHLRAWVASPIVITGRTWGQVAVFSRQGPLPAGTERRLADFTELVATAIANAKARAELTDSRARIVASADETRRKLERDLHDGAQQRLVTLAVQLRAAQATVPPELPDLAAELDGVAAGLNSAFEQLHELARGIHPPILAEGGLGPALKMLARRSAVPVDLDVRTEGRLPEPVEVGTYYVVSEALTNVAKHAEATTAIVEVEELDDTLRVLVRDDGAGGAVFDRGSGLVGLKDRVEALGGQVELQSSKGAGTTLLVELPLEHHGGGVASR